jgi:hypothetical protein
MSVCCKCCVLAGGGLCVGLITRQEKSNRVYVSECDHEPSTKKGLGPLGDWWVKKIHPPIYALLDKSESSKVCRRAKLSLFYPPSSLKLYSNNINFNASTLPSRSTKLPNSKRFPTKTPKTKSRTTSLNACSKGTSRAQTLQMAGRILTRGEVYHKLLNSKGIKSTSQQLAIMFLISSDVVFCSFKLT